ncbi:MAG: hypothetical protein E3J56_03455 [Candidatus Aminicenantes bacterium]|nr:MAG: hypothetical protein E3J56_03455 [Candidatus Aminicenantes bacterium]
MAKLLQPRFPNSVGGRLITFLRVVQKPSGSFVMRVVDPYKKTGKVVAKCTVDERQDGSYFFETTTQDVGHKDLCCLLRTQGIRGRYMAWLEAVESEEPMTWEKERDSGIVFECNLIEEGEEFGWKVKMDERFMEMEINP